jgi:8-oxo-dGTP pyrophosphatase MutT (NUDIX family)
MLEKVACFATRAGREAVELLTIRHPTAGTQVPAGTVENGETPQQAAAREFFEETKRVAVSVRKLSTLITELESPMGVLVSTPMHRDSQVQTGPPGGTFLRKGLPITILDRKAGELLVRYEERDYNVAPPSIISSVAGWVPVSAVSTTIVRYLCQVSVAPSEDASRWKVIADNQTWSLEWTPIDDGLHLFGEQQTWLKAVMDEISSS